MTALAQHGIAELEPQPLDAPPHTFCVRALNAIDGNAFRALRLEATRPEGKDAKYFAENDEATWPPERWRERVAPTPRLIVFGAWDGPQLVGVMGAWDYDRRDRTALWGNTYLREDYRRQRRAELIYAARETWTRRNPHYDSAVFFIREDNKRSREIHEGNGAVMFAKELKRWRDGSTAMACWYEKPMRSPTP